VGVYVRIVNGSLMDYVRRIRKDYGTDDINRTMRIHCKELMNYQNTQEYINIEDI
jgi:hypothetical protein